MLTRRWVDDRFAPGKRALPPDESAALFIPVEVGEGSGDFQDPMKPAGRQAHGIGGSPNQNDAPSESGCAICSITGAGQLALVEIPDRPKAANRRACRSRAPATRSLTSADPSAGGGRIRSEAVTAGTSMDRSIRSSRGPDIRAWYCAMQRSFGCRRQTNQAPSPVRSGRDSSPR